MLNLARAGAPAAILFRSWTARMRRADFAMLAIGALLLADLGWGLRLAFAIPPFGGSDEAYHWLRVREISFGELLARKLGPNDWGGTFDVRDIKLIGYFGIRYARGLPVDWHVAHDIARRLQGVAGTTAIGSFPSTASFAPLAYLPNVLGVAIARACGGDLLAQLHGGRMAGVLCYVGLSGLLVAILPTARLAAMAVLSMPAAVTQAATFSADPLNLMLPALLAACSLRLRLRPGTRFGMATRSGLVALAMSLGLLKMTSVVFSPVVLLVPTVRFASGAARWRFVATCICAAVAVALAWNVAYPFMPGLYWKTGADPRAALNALAAQPVHHVRAMLGEAWSAMPGLLQSAYGRVGAHPAADGTRYPAHVGWLGLAAILGLALGNRGPRAKAASFLLAALAGAAVILLMIAFRIAYNPPLVDAVTGVQGRYLHPAAFFLVLAVALLPIWRGLDGWANMLQAAGFAAAFAAQVGTILTVLGWLRETWG